MTTREEQLGLAGRCEAATGADRELDALIAPLTGLRMVEEGHPLGRCCYDGNGYGTPLPAYTASLDAAMTLVPDGAGLSLQRYWIAASDGPVWSAEISTGGIPSNPRLVFDCFDAATPALALTAAALRARAAQIGGGS